MDSADAAPPAPPGWRTVTPRIVARDARGLVEFMRRALGAAGEFQADRPAVLRLGDSLLMVSEAGQRPPSPAFLHIYVHDTDAAWRRAVEAGACTIEAPFDTPYGDRRCMVEDGWGNLWQLATCAA